MEILFTDEFEHWFSNLKDARAKTRIQARIDRAELGNLGDVAPIGSGISEMRIHYGPGYRVYFLQRGITLIVLLAGGHKGSQQKDIKRALEIAQQLVTRQ